MQAATAGPRIPDSDDDTGDERNLPPELGAWRDAAGPGFEDPEDDVFTFDADYGLYTNGDRENQVSADSLERGDTFQDPAYDGTNDWHVVERTWVQAGTVHVVPPSDEAP